ncbi:hypothetical protein, partial [Anaeromusa sp.]|uniref:hypothetical protein n=1 Tax=Anaeromusa sp. TaxID=1872520 RepID=UPI00261A2017
HYCCFNDLFASLFPALDAAPVALKARFKKEERRRFCRRRSFFNVPEFLKRTAKHTKSAKGVFLIFHQNLPNYTI